MDDQELVIIISIMIIIFIIIIFNQELVEEVVGLRRSVEEQGKKLADLENYIDTLVRRCITHKPWKLPTLTNTLIPWQRKDLLVSWQWVLHKKG